MKKILLIATGLLFVSGLFFIYFCVSQKQEEPKILSQLESKENGNGKGEFVFSITNVGKEETTLMFPTWLEYNVSISSLDNKEIESGEIIMRHLDLNEENREGRLLLLEPNEKLEYRLLLTRIPKGNYEINISSASGFGGVIREEFIINY
ncbi:hypothetical protein ACQCT3_15885 [Sutcliffiella horikoshii]|uniref:hypothetical protein n=1 Tax=Sutcliffiella horikoshii TaxID=79883 RepID=UPI003CECC392